jgi:parallel beta-helix repeat protein
MSMRRSILVLIAVAWLMSVTGLQAETRDALETPRTCRYRLAGLLVGRTVRTADIQASITAQVTAGSLSSINAATFGLFSGVAADASCSIASGAAVLTALNDNWTAADVGKQIDVAGAGAAGATLRSRIKTYTNSKSITLWDNASTTVAASKTSAGGLAAWGDDLTGITTVPKNANEANTQEQAATSLAVVSTGSTVGRTLSARFSESANVLDYGADNSGVSDSTTAFARAVSVLTTGGVVIVPPGSYVLASASLNALTDKAIPITVNGIQIVGQGKPTITVSGVAACGVFYAKAITNFSVTGCKFVGNNVNAAGGIYGTAVVWDNIGATGALSGFVCCDNDFTNFKGDSWVQIQRDSSADYDMTDWRIERNTFSGGSSRDLTASGVASAAIYITANDIVAGASELKRGRIANNRVDASTIKQGIEIISNNATRINMEDIVVEGNQVDNAGLDATAIYGYGISVYGYIRGVKIRGNTISTSRHAGIYCVSCYDIIIAGNEIHGQNDVTNAALARGGIAITNGSNWLIEGNKIWSCIRGLDVYTDRSIFTTFDAAYPTRSSAVTGNVISECSEMGISARPRGEPILVTDNDVNCAAGSYGFQCVASTQSQDLYLTVQGNRISGLFGAFCSITTGASFVKELRFIDNVIYASTGNGIQVTAADANGIAVVGNRIVGDQVTTGIYGLRLASASEATVAGNTVQDYATAYRLGSVTGRLEGNTAFRCALVIHNGGSDFGQDTPAWGNWTAGNAVQKLDAASAGYIGWVITVGGTFGTLNGGATTGGITSGLKTLVVNSATGLTIGSRITIAGVTGVKTVTAINGTTITIDTAADATVAGAAVANSAPTVKTFGLIS